MDEPSSHPQLLIVRRPGDGIVINGDIFVRVLRVLGDTVELEVVAPNELPVYRGEDYAELKRRLREGGVGGEE
jgi:carbon storage regulator CsrA